MCEINPILYQNQVDKLPQIRQDYEDIRQAVDKENSLPSIFDIIPTFRRIERVPQKLEDSDFVPAAGLVSLAVLNGPEDLRDMKSAYRQIKSYLEHKTPDLPYNYKIAQHPFSFFRGTLLQKFVNPETSPCPKLAEKLLDNDKTLMQTKLGKWLVKQFGIKEFSVDTTIKEITHTESKPDYVKAKKFVTNSIFGELTARGMTRTTKIGTMVLGGLEAAHLAREISDGENILKSSAKSAISFASSLAGIGYGGAIGAKYFGPAGSLIGMGLGAIAGNKVNELLD